MALSANAQALANAMANTAANTAFAQNNPGVGAGAGYTPPTVAPTPPAGSYVINPGSVYQSSYEGGTVSYPTAPANYASNANQTIQAPTVITPTSTPIGASVYQGQGLGFAPMSSQTAFKETTVNGTQKLASEYSLANGNIKVPAIATSLKLDTEASNNLTTELQKNNKQQELRQSVENTLADQSQLSKPVNSAYIQALAQAKFGRPATSSELGITTAKDYNPQFDVSKMTVAQASARFGFSSKTQIQQTQIPGAKADVPETNIPADQTISKVDGTIDQTKLLTNLTSQVNDINTLIADERAAFDESIGALGQELGTVMPLIQGDQAYQEQRKNIRLQKLVDLKSSAIETGNLQLKVLDYADKLRSDQKDAMASIISTFLSNGVPISDTMAQQYSKLTGIDSRALSDGFAIATKNYLAKQKSSEAQQSFDNKLALDKQNQSLSGQELTNDYKNWTLAGGEAGTGMSFNDYLNKGGVSSNKLKLTPGIAEDLITMKTLDNIMAEVLVLGEKNNWSGVGGIGYGSVAEFLAKNFGSGDKTGQEIRDKISNVKATIAKLRGGTSFTTNEQQLLESYTPTINDSPLVIDQKIKDLQSFIQQKRDITSQLYDTSALGQSDVAGDNFNW